MFLLTFFFCRWSSAISVWSARTPGSKQSVWRCWCSTHRCVDMVKLVEAASFPPFLSWWLSSFQNLYSNHPFTFTFGPCHHSMAGHSAWQHVLSSCGWCICANSHFIARTREAHAGVRTSFAYTQLTHSVCIIPLTYSQRGFQLVWITGVSASIILILTLKMNASIRDIRELVASAQHRWMVCCVLHTVYRVGPLGLKRTSRCFLCAKTHAP